MALTQIPTERFNLLGTAIGVLRKRWLGAFFPKVLTRLTERLRYPGHRLDDVVLPDVQP
jgi:hypothetical protein